MHAAGRQLPPDQRLLERHRLELAQQQLRRIEAVAEGEGCREQSLLLAVGEIAPACGRCDNCLASPASSDWTAQAALLLAALEGGSGRDLRSLAEDLAAVHGSGQDGWAWLARRLVQEELISESDDGSQRLFLRPVGRSYLRDPWPLRWAA